MLKVDGTELVALVPPVGASVIEFAEAAESVAFEGPCDEEAVGGDVIEFPDWPGTVVDDELFAAVAEA